MSIILTVVMVGGYTHMSKLIHLCKFNMFSLLCVKYISVGVFLRKKEVTDRNV